jgi:pSer/pThr/pTyr-binding forkhead associated (FHA) protein
MFRQAALYLIHGPRRWALQQRPLTIGRHPDCDVTIPGDEVSRNHAYIVPTPSGPLLIDGSRTGTMVNRERMHAPWVLADGDEILIGVSTLRVVLAGASSPEKDEAPGTSPWRRKLGSWIRRYGPSEVLGTVAAVGAASGVQQFTGSTVAAAYAGALAEALVFYGVMFLRTTIREAHEAGGRGRPYGNADLLRVIQGMMLEFGAAEALDSFVLRPLLMGLGIRLLGTNLGALVGKLASDVVFYGPVLTIYEWRLTRGEALRQTDRRRRTTVTRMVPPES